MSSEKSDAILNAARSAEGAADKAASIEHIDLEHGTLRTIFDHSPVAISVVQVGGESRRLYYNASYEKLFEVEKGAPVVALSDSYANPGDRERILSEMEEKGRLEGLEVERRRADGSTFWVHMSSQRLDVGGEIADVIWVFDISDRKRAEAASAENEARLHAIIDNTPAPITLKDTAGRYVLVNKRFLDRRGLTPDQVIGKTADELYPSAETAATVIAQDREMLESGRTMEFELVSPEVDGSEHTYLSYRFPVFGPGGEITGLGGINTDITERKEMEQAQRDLLEAISLPIVVSRADTNELLYVNKRANDLYGIEVGDGERSVADAYVDPADRLELVRLLTEQGLLDDFEARIYDAEGTPIWVLMSARTFTYRGHRSVLVASYDIDERKRLEQDVADKEAQLRSALDSMSGAIFMIDADFTIRVLNERLLDFYDISPERLHVGGSFLELMRLRAERGDYGPGESEVLLQERIKGYFDHPVSIVEDRVPSGRILEVRRVLIDGGGMVGVCNDITDRVRLQEEAAEKSAILEATMNNTDEGILMADGDMQVAAYNRRFLELMDLPDDAFADDRSIATYVRFRVDRGDYGPGDPAELAAGIMDRLEEIEVGGESFIAEVRSPGYPDLELRLNRIDAGGFVSSYIDIGDRKRAERELLEARDAAEEATKAKAAFLATMSHEIRTPMNGVIGMIDLLCESSLDDDQMEMADTVRNSAHALLTIINDILDFSKIDAGQLSLESIPISIRDVVEGVAQSLAPTSRKKNVALRTYIDPEIPDAVMGDSVRLGQILFNIAGNALKFTEDGKALMRADRIAASSEDRAGIRFQIIDTGIGIPKDRQADLFTAFTQAEASTTRRYGGTGLGLSICQRLTELMGGSIGVDSEPGKGSTFSVEVEFPVGPADAIASDGQDLSGLSVLQVSRDPDFTHLFGDYLRFWKAAVEQDHDLKNAVSLARAAAKGGTPYDVVILGSGWPTADGRQVIEEFRADPALAATRFVLMNPSRRTSERQVIENTVYVDARPTRRASFLRAVAQAAGRMEAIAGKKAKEPPKRRRQKAPTVEEAAAMGQLILMAEDNPTNQALLGRQLSRLGFAAEVANDGEEALAAMAEKPYAILLTDCHMPNMDGYELARSVRRSEEESDARLPIIAITASAMQEDAERCFEAGMDDFLVKPVDLDKLKATLLRWMPTDDASRETTADNAASVASAAAGEVGGAAAVVDVLVLAEAFGGEADEDLLRHMLGVFIEPARQAVANVSQGMDDRSTDDIGAAAHTLKSSSRSIGAHELAALCEALEAAAQSEDWAAIEDTAPRLEPTLGRVLHFIESY